MIAVYPHSLPSTVLGAFSKGFGIFNKPKCTIKSPQHSCHISKIRQLIGQFFKKN